MPRWHGWLRTAIDGLLPPRCLACGEPGDGGRDLCAACHRALPRAGPACRRCALPLQAAASGGAPLVCGTCLKRPLPLDEVRATFLYAPPLDRLLPRFKFHHDLAAGRLLGQLMADGCAPHASPLALVPVPLHRSRLRQRGYDQALELARPLARALGLPVRADLLRRTRATSAQSTLDAGLRRRNLRGAFEAQAMDVPDHLVLVDDVMTTGATLAAAAIALRRAGARRVDAWVCARTP